MIIAQQGTIPVAGYAVLPASALEAPYTVTLKSSNAGRLIQVSTDGGTEYFTPSLNQSSTTQVVLVVKARVSHIKLTGASGDTWRAL